MTHLELTVFSAMHLHYEIDMLVRVAKGPLGLRGQPIYTVDRNAVIESYAIHLRNLIDFLYASAKGDDVGAVHYVRDIARWEAALGPMPAVLTEARERVGKQIAHLTRRRFEDGAAEKTWHPETEIPAITKSLKLFVEHSDPMKLHSVVIARVEWLPDLWTGGDSTE